MQTVAAAAAAVATLSDGLTKDAYTIMSRKLYLMSKLHEDDDEFVGRENLRRVRGARRGRARGPGADVDDRTALALEDGVVRRRGRERGLDRDAGSAGEGGDGTDVRREDGRTADRWTGGNV